MLFFKRGFVRLGSVLHIFLDHRKSQKISKNLKQTQKIKTSQKNLKISQICWKKAKNKKKTSYFASSDPHHDISKQLVDTTFV